MIARKDFYSGLRLCEQVECCERDLLINTAIDRGEERRD
jgi:hypothetical protein